MDIIVASDFHIGTRRCRLTANPELNDEVIEQFQQADAVFLNGDIIEILIGSTKAIFSTDEDINLQKDRARKVINKFLCPILDRCPNTTFYFIDGNHETGDERQAEFIHEIFHELEQEYPGRFFFLGKAARIGDFVITHGHDYLRGAPESRAPVDLLPRIYDAIDFPLTDINGFIFGHTHAILYGYKYNGISFYNTGTLYGDSDPGILLKLKLEGDFESGKITEVTQIMLQKDTVSINQPQH